MCVILRRILNKEIIIIKMNEISIYVTDKTIKMPKGVEKKANEKEYSILTNETAFYAKIIKETPATQKLTKITNKDKEAVI